MCLLYMWYIRKLISQHRNSEQDVWQQKLRRKNVKANRKLITCMVKLSTKYTLTQWCKDSLNLKIKR